MSDKPILFSAPMIRALLDGRKTQTRRIMKKKAAHDALATFGPVFLSLPGNRDLLPINVIPGDRLWVKETWRPSISAADPWHVAVLYPHTGDVKHWNWSSDADFGDWKIPKAAATGNVTPLFMPRWASRLTLTVTDVRVQRLQEISEADAVDEGIDQIDQREGVPIWRNYANGQSILSTGGLVMPTASFHSLWNSLHGPDAWHANPWVVALTFDVHRRNIDQMVDPA